MARVRRGAGRLMPRVEIPVQVNGRVRARIRVPPGNLDRRQPGLHLPAADERVAKQIGDAKRGQGDLSFPTVL